MSEAKTLSDGRELIIIPLVYPLGWENQQRFVSLWRSEWRYTEVHWMEAMNGDYSETLTICSLVGEIENTPVGTATVYYARENPGMEV